jgi:branched-chain amino acid aminotransferase
MQDAYFGLFNGTTEDKWGWLDYVYPQDAEKNTAPAK